MRILRFTLIAVIASLASLLMACPASNQSVAITARGQHQLIDYLPHAFHHSLWSSMSAGFDLNHAESKPVVTKMIEQLSQRQDYIDELIGNAKPYIFYIVSQTEIRDLPTELALIPMIESDYNPFVYSRQGATGLWQMMPGTASGFGLKINWWFDGRRDIMESTQAALRYLKYLHNIFGDWLLAIAAYDAGEGTVKAAIRYNQKHHRPTDFWSLSLPRETQSYIPKLLALASIIRKHHHYGLSLMPVQNHPFFKPIKMKGQITLKHIAELANTSIQTVRQLNPGFRRWTTIPKKNYWILLPVDKADIFTANLIQSEKESISWDHHTVKPGDSLSVLAHHHHTTIQVLKRINHLNNTKIHIGQRLLIPNSSHIDLSKKVVQQDLMISEDHLPGPKRFVTIVKSGDTLSSIAKHYRVKTPQIRYWNHLSYHQKLQPGQEIIVWKKPKYRHYTVKPGDSLSRIAFHKHIPIHVIKKLNHLTTNQIKIGQILVLPV